MSLASFLEKDKERFIGAASGFHSAEEAARKAAEEAAR